MIKGTVTRQCIDPDNKDRCEINISKESSDKLPHEYRKKKLIDITIGKTLYEAGVHENKTGVVWISSVLHKKETKEKTRLVDALAEIGLKKGDKVSIKKNENGTFVIMPKNLGNT